jgi:hypothetical protein
MPDLRSLARAHSSNLTDVLKALLFARLSVLNRIMKGCLAEQGVRYPEAMLNSRWLKSPIRYLWKASGSEFMIDPQMLSQPLALVYFFNWSRDTNEANLPCERTQSRVDPTILLFL